MQYPPPQLHWIIMHAKYTWLNQKYVCLGKCETTRYERGEGGRSNKKKQSCTWARQNDLKWVFMKQPHEIEDLSAWAPHTEFRNFVNLLIQTILVWKSNLGKNIRKSAKEISEIFCCKQWKWCFGLFFEYSSNIFFNKHLISVFFEFKVYDVNMLCFVPEWIS